MPWHIEPVDGGYFVTNSETGKHMSKKPLSKAVAQRQLGALYANVPDVQKSKALSNSPRNILESAIHRSFTVTADSLLALGYIDRETRIALSGAIGEVLDLFGKSVCDLPANGSDSAWVERTLDSVCVSPTDVDTIIASKEVSGEFATMSHGPGGLFSVPGIGGAEPAEDDATDPEDVLALFLNLPNRTGAVAK